MTDGERLAWLSAIVGKINAEDFPLAFVLSSGFGRRQGPSLHRCAKTLGEPLEAVRASLERLQHSRVVGVLSRWPKNAWPRSFGPGELGVADAEGLAVAEALAARRMLRAVQAERRRRRRAG